MHIAFVLLAMCFVACTTNLSFAQLGVDNPADKKALSQMALSNPLIYKISDRGIYNVTLKSGQSSPLSGLNFEIVFLNASFKNTNAPLPAAEPNVTFDNPAAIGLTVPSVVEHVIPVKSFDIAVTSSDGKELSKKINEVPKGGRILENIDLKGYTGNITISLDNIVPDPVVTDSIKKQLNTSNDTAIIDSAELQARVQQS
jgi:hypothetical protein